MADIKVLLKIHEAGNGTINAINTSIPTNNVSSIKNSNNIISWVNSLGAKNKNFLGAKTNPLGLFKLGSNTNGFLGVKDIHNSPLNDYTGVILGYTNSNSQLNLTITLRGTDIGNLKIVFDYLNGNYPTSYTVREDGGTARTYSNASNELQLTGILGTSSVIEINFLNWSKPNTIVGITYIENQVINEPLDKKWINSFTTQNQLTSQPQQALYGLVQNTGSLELKDYNNRLFNYAETGYLKLSSFGVEIYINDKIVEKHIVSDNPYYSSDKTMSIRLSNFGNSQTKIAMQNFNIERFSTTLYDVVNEFLTRIGYSSSEIDNIFTEDIVYQFGGSYDVVDMYSYFDNMLFQNNFTIREDNIINLFNMFCQATRTYVYVNSEGKLKFIAATVKKIIDDSKVIDIPYKKQASAFSFDIIKTNNYDDVEIGALGSSPNAKNVLFYGDEEILDVLYYEPKNTNMTHFIQSEILDDYKDGIRTGVIDIFPSDFYNSNGDLLKNWANGDLIEVNDIVRIMDKNNNAIFGYWQVLDRVVSYKGQVIVTLTLREVKRIVLEE